MTKICGDCGATYIGDVCLMLPCEQKREEGDTPESALADLPEVYRTRNAQQRRGPQGGRR